MSNYHTASLFDSDIFTLMGSIYAEVARYDTAINSDDEEQANNAAKRAQEIIDFSLKLEQVKPAQKLEIFKLREIFNEKVEFSKASMLDDYLMPFAVSARLRQFK